MVRPFLEGVHPIPIAHRGSRVLWPENTMAAFQGAVDLGFRFLETDLHATRDGVLVCFHDDRMERTTDASGLVWDLTYRDLLEVDAGFRHAPSEAFPFRGKRLRIPTLEEVVATFPEVRMVLDLKQHGLERYLADLIAHHHLWDRVIVGSFHPDRLRRFREATGGRVATSTGPDETRRVVASGLLGRTPSVQADALIVPRFYRGVRVVSKRLVEAAHRGGLQVHVWTVNLPSEMHGLLDLGIDGLISDRPDLLRQVLEGRGAWHG